MAAYQNSGDRVFPLRKPLEPRSLKSMSKHSKQNGVTPKPNGGAVGNSLSRGCSPRSLKLNPPEPNPNRTITEPHFIDFTLRGRQKPFQVYTRLGPLETSTEMGLIWSVADSVAKTLQTERGYP